MILSLEWLFKLFFMAKIGWIIPLVYYEDDDRKFSNTTRFDLILTNFKR